MCSGRALFSNQEPLGAGFLRSGWKLEATGEGGERNRLNYATERSWGEENGHFVAPSQTQNAPPAGSDLKILLQSQEKGTKTPHRNHQKTKTKMGIHAYKLTPGDNQHSICRLKFPLRLFKVTFVLLIRILFFFGPILNHTKRDD